jgi:hypothetical protein
LVLRCFRRESASADSYSSCRAPEQKVWRRERDLNPRGPKGPQACGLLIPGLGFLESAPYQAREPRLRHATGREEFKAVHSRAIENYPPHPPRLRLSAGLMFPHRGVCSPLHDHPFDVHRDAFLPIEHLPRRKQSPA